MKPRPGAALPLLDWQRTYLADGARFKFAVACRQSGKSYVGALEDVLAAIGGERLSVILSAGQRQSLEVMEKVRLHVRALGAMAEVTDSFFADTSLLQQTAAFPGGQRIVALPANPDTARGYTGNVRLDEFGVHRDSRAIWAALYPTITRGYKVRVTSTYKGTDNKFHELGKLLGLHTGLKPEAQPVTNSGWSGHWVDIYMVAEQAARCPGLGLRIDPEELRRGLDDDEVWLQEFCNVPMSGAEQFIPAELALACESELASVVWDGESRPGLGAGMDIGRVRDRTVIVIGDRVSGLAIVRGILWLERTPFEEQVKLAGQVARAVEAGGGRFCIDATGMGMPIAEKLAREFACVESVNFAGRVEAGAPGASSRAVSVSVKERMAVAVKRRMEERTLRIPESAQLRRACAAIKRTVGPAGQPRFDAARTEQGHADEFWALALWLSGLETAAAYVPAALCGAAGRPLFSGLLEREF